MSQSYNLKGLTYNVEARPDIKMAKSPKKGKQTARLFVFLPLATRSGYLDIFRFSH